MGTHGRVEGCLGGSTVSPSLEGPLSSARALGPSPPPITSQSLVVWVFSGQSKAPSGTSHKIQIVSFRRSHTCIRYLHLKLVWYNIKINGQIYANRLRS